MSGALVWSNGQITIRDRTFDTAFPEVTIEGSSSRPLSRDTVESLRKALDRWLVEHGGQQPRRT